MLGAYDAYEKNCHYVHIYNAQMCLVINWEGLNQEGPKRSFRCFQLRTVLLSSWIQSWFNMLRLLIAKFCRFQEIASFSPQCTWRSFAEKRQFPINFQPRKFDALHITNLLSAQLTILLRDRPIFSRVSEKSPNFVSDTKKVKSDHFCSKGA